MKKTTVTFYEGESVFDVLQRLCKKKAIYMEARVDTYLQQCLCGRHPEDHWVIILDSQEAIIDMDSREQVQ